jgi:hypothetical protein
MDQGAYDMDVEVDKGEVVAVEAAVVVGVVYTYGIRTCRRHSPIRPPDGRAQTKLYARF